MAGNDSMSWCCAARAAISSCSSGNESGRSGASWRRGEAEKRRPDGDRPRGS